MHFQAIETALYPTTYQLLKRKSAKHYEYLAASKLPGFSVAFRSAFEENLALTFTEKLFKGDHNFCGDLAGEDESAFMSRISELWLAAYFVRGGFEPKRVKQKHGNKPDFQITVSSENTTRELNVEVKRIFEYDNPRDRHVHLESVIWPSAPTHLHQTDFVAQLSKRLSDEKGITAKQLGWAGARGIIALDIAASHDFQLNLYSDSDAESIAWLRDKIGDEAMQKNTDIILCFASTLTDAKLHSCRWFNLSESSRLANRKSQIENPK